MSNAALTDEWVLGGRYRCDAPIASGGMGEVYRGYDLQLDRRVAIKLMQPPPAPPFRPGTAEATALAEAAAHDRERFLREIRTMAGLELPGIPAVYDIGIEETTDRPYLVMQLIYGQTLDDLIASRDYPTEPWPLSWAAAIAAQVAATLMDVHRVDVVHRDLKPSNLMVSANGLVKTLDFGVAILRGARALPKLTQVGMTVGSPPYMSPEQVLSNPVGPAADIYALGCVLYEMLTGRVPFVETLNRSYRDHHLNTPASSLRDLRPEVPPDLDHLVVAMLAKGPADRPDAEAVYNALMPFVRADPSQAAGDRDPRRPFLRPLAPVVRRNGSKSAPSAANPVVPMSIDEALDVKEHVDRLIADSQLRSAIDLLKDAVARSAQLPELQLEMKIELATALYLADEFSPAAALFDAVLPAMAGRQDAVVLRYYAGVSHAETGDIDAAVDYLAAFLADVDPGDSLSLDATYQLGMLLPAVGRGAEGLQHLESLRPVLLAKYGPESVHVITLDRRIAQVQSRAEAGNGANG